MTRRTLYRIIVAGKLRVDASSEGWGLYLLEDLGISAVIGMAPLIFFLASLLSLIFWIVLKDHLQGASEVSSYIVAVTSTGGLWIAIRSKSFG